MKKIHIIIIIIVLVLVGAGIYFLTQSSSDTTNAPVNPVVTTEPTQPGGQPVVTPTEEDKTQSVIGKSVEGRDITAFHYGTGGKELLFVGGLHGGYAWNTVLVAYELMDFLKENPTTIPENVKVTVVPVLNPDGLNKVIGTAGRFAQADVTATQTETIPGRFNAHTVDLNRNFDCDWQAEGKWQNRTVSGGTAAFSEPESQALKNYVDAHKPAGAVVWYSAAGGVFASSCHNGVSAETRALTNTYAKASGYRAYESFDFYEITGDMVNWLAKMNVPAISVLLSTHDAVEWTKNRAGIEAMLKSYAN